MSNKNNEKANNTKGGIGFCGLLAIAFIVLRLCNIIKWSWLWVLSPLWIPFALILVVLVFYLIVAIIATAFDK